MNKRQFVYKGRRPRLSGRLLIALAAFAGVTPSWAASGLPITFETRTYVNPSPGSDRFFGYEADVSSKYVGVLGGRSGSYTATEFNAFIFDAATGERLWTFTQPVPADNVNFRFTSIAIDGDLAVVGATYEHVPLPGGGMAYNAGAAYVYDLQTGQLKHKLVSNTPQSNFLLGQSVDISGNRIAVGGWLTAYLFDAVTGAQLTRFTPSSPSSPIGISVALGDSRVIVGSNSDESQGTFTGAVFTFDLTSYAELSKLVPSTAAAFDNFGIATAVDGGALIGAGRGGVFAFDVASGAELTRLALPNFPANAIPDVAMNDTVALLAGNGQAIAFDWRTGAAVQQLAPSSFAPGFGGSVAVSGNSAVVATGEKVLQYRLVPEPAAWMLIVTAIGVAVISRDALRQHQASPAA
jgi:outer membrane protein assembly factor BamB